MAGPYVEAADLAPALNSSKDGSRLRNWLVNPYNDNMRFWQAGLAKMRSGSRNAVITVNGDSTSRGSGSTGSGYAANGIAKSWPALLADFLTAHGTRASAQSTFGEGLIGANAATFDPRISVGPATRAAISSFGGPPWLLSSAGTWKFTPTVPVSTFDVYYLSHPSNASYIGSATVKIDGGATLETINTQQAQLYRKATYTAALGTHSIDLGWVSGNFIILGVVAYDSAKKEISVLNGGWPNSTSNNWASPLVGTGFAPLSANLALAPDLSAISLGINDWQNGPTAVAAYEANIDTLVSYEMVYSTVVLISPPPSNPTTATLEQQTAFVDAMRRVAIARDVAMIDLFSKWTSYAVRNPLGYYRDGLHPTDVGYSDTAQAVTDVLLSS